MYNCICMFVQWTFKIHFCMIWLTRKLLWGTMKGGQESPGQAPDVAQLVGVGLLMTRIISRCRHAPGLVMASDTERYQSLLILSLMWCYVRIRLCWVVVCEWVLNKRLMIDDWWLMIVIIKMSVNIILSSEHYLCLVSRWTVQYCTVCTVWVRQ